jgi:chromosome segregation ATPase
MNKVKGVSNMLEKLNQQLKMYEERLERKRNLVKALHDKQNGLNELSQSEYTQMMVFESEIRQLEEIIEDLKYIKE